MITQMKAFLSYRHRAAGAALPHQCRISSARPLGERSRTGRRARSGRSVPLCRPDDVPCRFADCRSGSARTVGSSRALQWRQCADLVRFANGSEGSISYLANGDRSFSKERMEVFGGRSTAVLDDFRRLEFVRNGRKETVHSRWRQDKGHRAEWAAFADSSGRAKLRRIAFRRFGVFHARDAARRRIPGDREARGCRCCGISEGSPDAVRALTPTGTNERRTIDLQETNASSC